MKKVAGNLQDWDQLQLDLAKIFSQQSGCEFCLEEEGLSAKERRELTNELSELILKEKEVRKKIAALSRSLHVELKNRKE